MTIDEIKTGDNTAVPVDDLMQRSGTPPRHENGMLVTDGDIQILRLNLREAETQIAAKDKEIASLNQAIEALKQEANVAVQVLTNQRNNALTQAAQLEVELTLLKQQQAQPQPAKPE